MFTKEQLQPISDRIYAIIESEMGGLLAGDETLDTPEYGKETADEHNERVTHDAIKKVLDELENDLVLAWYSDPSAYYFGL